MSSRVPLVIVFAASSAFAQPRGPRQPAARVPTRPVPCLPDDSTLHTTGADAVVCWAKGCMKLDMENTDASWLVKPPAVKTWLGPVADVKDDSVCVGATCKPFGKKLAAAIAEYKKNLDPSAGPAALYATTDLKAVVVGYDQAWSLQGDRKLAFTKPKLYARSPEKPAVAGIQVAGDLLVVGWSACAGPCTKFSITDSAGRPKGAEGEAGEVFQLDAKRFVVFGEYATVQIFEVGTAKPRGAVKLPADPEQSDVIRADDSTIFARYMQNDGMQFVKISAYDDKTLPPRVETGMFLPKCNP